MPQNPTKTCPKTPADIKNNTMLAYKMVDNSDLSGQKSYQLSMLQQKRKTYTGKRKNTFAISFDIMFWLISVLLFLTTGQPTVTVGSR